MSVLVDPPSRRDPPVVRIGVVDDDTILARSLVRAFSREADFEVVFVAESLAEGIERLRQDLDVLLVDLGLPDGSGLDLIDHPSRPASCRVLVVTVFGDGRSVVQAIERGAQGYLLKGSEPEEAVAAVRRVLEGGAPISPAVAGHILSRVRGLASPRKPDAKSGTRLALTPREITVLEHLAKGLSFKEVAQVERISYHTVTDHVKAIYRKLHVNSRGEAVFEALASGLIDVNE